MTRSLQILATLAIAMAFLIPTVAEAQEDLLYVIERGAGQELSTVDGNGTVTLLADNLQDPLFVARLDNGNLLVTERGGGGLLTEIDPTTGIETSSTNHGFQPNEVLVEGNDLWVTTFDGRLLKSTNGNTGPFSTIVSGGLGDSFGPLRFNGDLYIANTGGQLFRIDGSSAVLVTSGLGLALGLLEFEGGILVTDFGGGMVRKINFDAFGNVTTIDVFASGLPGASSLTLASDGGVIVSQQKSLGRLVHVDANGTVTEIVETNDLTYPRGILGNASGGGGAPPVSQSIIFEDFSDLSPFHLNGSASGAVNTQGADVLRVTPAIGGQAGSAFLIDPISLANNAAFSTAFSFQISNSGGCCTDDDGPGADGMVFVVTQTPNAVGLSGAGIGYQGIPNSIGVEFDTWNNSPNNPNHYYPDSYGDDSGNHVAVNVNGNISAPIGYADISPRMNNGALWYAWVDYDGASTTLEVRLSQSSQRPTTPIITVASDLALALGDNVYIGFTAGTGGAYGNHDVVGLQFNNEYDPIVDVPGSSNNPPVADAGPAQNITCTTAAGTDVTLDGSTSSDPDSDPLSYSWSEGGTQIATGVGPIVSLAPGLHTITLVVNDGTVDSAPSQVVITIVEDTTDPLVTLNGLAEFTLECNIDTYAEAGATATDDCDGAVAVTITGSVDVSVVEDYILTYTATDAAGNSGQATRLVHVVDTTPPTIASNVVSTSLWPPNHKMHLILSGIAAADLNDGTVAPIIVVSSDEDINGQGDGDTDFDYEVIENADGSFDVYVRAERTGKSDGRTYTITVDAADAAGNDTETQTFTATVAKSKGKGKNAKLAALVPDTYGLDAAMPNPFNPSTTLAYQLPEAGEVSLIIYNAMGQQIRELERGFRAQGVHQIEWNGRDDNGRAVSSGLYLYRFVSAGLIETRSMTLLK